MKKIFSIISAGLMLLSASSCVKDNLAVFDPGTAKAPVLGSYEVGTKKVTAEYTPGSFNMGFNEKMAVNHSIALVSAGGNAVSKVLASGSDGKISVTNATISKALTALGYNYDQTVDIELAIRASLQDPTKDNGRNGFVDSKDLIKISAFLVEAPATNPFEGFTKESPWGVTGSIEAHGISWDKDIAMVSDGTWHVAKSVTLTADDQFKFRKDGAWDVNVGAAGDTEPFVVSLDEEIAGAQGGKNLAVGTDGVYDLWVNGETNAFKVTEAYNPYPDFKETSTWGITGALSSYSINWDGDIAMLTDGKGSYLAQGVRITKEDQFKFRKDQAWDENYGGSGDAELFVVSLDTPLEAVAGGKNLAVPADGVYDLILNEEAKTITVVETLGGPASKKIGGDDPTPVPTFEGWSVIGTVNGSTEWNTDFDMEEIEAGVFYINGVALTADSEFKIRKDHDWATAYGTAPDATVALDAAFAATTDNGGNIKLGSETKVDITLNTNDNTILLATHKALYSLIGSINGTAWDKDFNMTESDGKWIINDVQIDGEFKVRYDASWADADCYGVADGQEYGVGTAFELTQPGANINFASGKYNVTFDPAAKTLLVENSMPSDTWSLIGVNGDWDNDIFMEEVLPGVWASPTTQISGEFKLRFNHGWDVNRGCDPLKLGGPAQDATQNGPNIKIEDGEYIVIYDANEEIIYLQSWTMTGTINGTVWNVDFPMIPVDVEDGQVAWMSYVFTTEANAAFKIRQDCKWENDRGGTFVDFCTPFDVTNGGADIKIENAGYYFAAYYPALEQMGIGRADWGVVGGFNNWDNDVVMLETEKGIYTASVIFPEETTFKIRQNRAWENDRGGTMEALGTAFKAVAGGADIKCAAGAYTISYDSNAETITVTADE